MLYDLKIHTRDNTVEHETFDKNHYFYWEFLMLLVLGRCNAFEIFCDAKDLEGIEFGNKYGKRIEYEHVSELAFSGAINMRLRYQFVARFRNSYNRVKWKSVFLLKDNKVVFSAREYGTIVEIFALTEKNKTAVEQFFSSSKNPYDYFDLIPVSDAADHE